MNSVLRERRAGIGKRHARRGYVLVMALAMITLAGFLLAGVARSSLSAATEACDAREELQRRWGAISCQRVFLNQAPAIFQALDELSAGNAPGRPEGRLMAGEITLGKMVFELRLADECAKANLNAAYARRGGAAAVKKLCREFAGGALPLELRPAATNQARGFDSWGQVFAADESAAPEAMPRLLAEATQRLTCWGSGKLNVRRAPDDVLRSVARLVVSQKAANDLVGVRRRNADGDLKKWLSAIDIAQQSRRKLAQVLSEDSNCYSLWITASTPQRRRHELVVCEYGANNEVRTSLFHW